jgi:two-component system C4-dicarboxylate transport response regulator DctD
VTLAVPPLSVRRDDIPLLFLRLLAEAAARHRIEAVPALPPSVLAAMGRLDWPGNVRELRNAADRFALGLGLGVGTEPASGQTAQPSADQGARPQERSQDRLADRVAAFERREIEAALAAHGGTLRPVYESLGLSRKSLYEKIQKLGIDKTAFIADSDG